MSQLPGYYYTWTLYNLQPLDEHVLVGAMRGSGWLGENLGMVGEASRPLEVSLVALALHLTSSPHASDAFHILSRNARQEGQSEQSQLIMY